LFTAGHFEPSTQGQPRSGGQNITSFFHAIAMNRTNEAMTMLNSDTNLAVARWNFSKLPLLEAAKAGSLPLVKRLIELGADIDARGDTLMSGGSLNTALHLAVDNSHPDICQYLLETGADPNVKAFSFDTPLHRACTPDRKEMAQTLLDYGADPFVQRMVYNSNLTPLELSITDGDGTLVPRMLGQDRSRPLGNKLRKKPTAKSLIHARQKAETLLKKRGFIMLTEAAQRDELEAVQALLNAGMTMEKQNTSVLRSMSVAENAASKNKDFNPGSWKTIRSLLEKNGAVFDAFAATALGDLPAARSLIIEQPALAESRDEGGNTLLHWSVENDQLSMTSFWLTNGLQTAATNLAGQTALHLAVQKNLPDQVKLLLAAHSPLDVRDTNGWTPLDAAMRLKNSGILQIFLNDKSVKTPTGRGLSTSLHKAAAEGNVAALAALSENASQLEARNELGLTPLQVAVLNGHLAAAALLVDRGANINVRDPDGNTLLLNVIPMYFKLIPRDRPPTNWLNRMGNDPRRELYVKYLTVPEYSSGPSGILQAASFLLASGIDANATNHAGQSAMQLATDEKTDLFNDRAALLQLLASTGNSVNQTDAGGNTPLHLAGQESITDRIKSLLAAGAQVNATNHLGQTPLHKYAERIWGWDVSGNGDSQPFQLLIKSGANVNAQDNAGLSPLHVIAATETSFKKEATQLLLKSGANPNLRDNQGRTPLHLFFTGKWPWEGASQCIPLLVDAGADISAKDNSGKTPLHYLAALGGQKPLFFIHDITNIFEARNTVYDARDNDGNTPLLIAAKSGTRDVFDWLVKKGASLDATNNAGETPRILSAQNPGRFPPPMQASSETDIFRAISDNDLGAAARLLRALPNLVNQTNQFYQSPLRYAVSRHKTNMIAFLESHGAKWDITTAVMAGRADMVGQLLKENPAAVNTTNFGCALVHIAAENQSESILKLLLDAGASLDATDAWGLSPLGHALIAKAAGARELLLRRGARENFHDALYADDLPVVASQLENDRALLNQGKPVLPIEIAAACGYTDILKLLLKKHALLDSKEPGKGPFPLHFAVFFNETNPVALLLRAGADVNKIDASGLAPLHWAALQDAAASADLLLHHKADMKIGVALPTFARNSPNPMISR
jgi:ankyrin repeat protein